MNAFSFHSKKTINVFLSFLPEEKEMESYITVIGVAKETKGKHIIVVMNNKDEKAVAYVD